MANSFKHYGSNLPLLDSYFIFIYFWGLREGLRKLKTQVIYRARRGEARLKDILRWKFPIFWSFMYNFYVSNLWFAFLGCQWHSFLLLVWLFLLCARLCCPQEKDYTTTDEKGTINIIVGKHRLSNLAHALKSVWKKCQPCGRGSSVSSLDEFKTSDLNTRQRSPYSAGLYRTSVGLGRSGTWLEDNLG